MSVEISQAMVQAIGKLIEPDLPKRSKNIQLGIMHGSNKLLNVASNQFQCDAVL